MWCFVTLCSQKDLQKKNLHIFLTVNKLKRLMRQHLHLIISEESTFQRSFPSVPSDCPLSYVLIINLTFRSDQQLSRVRLFATPCISARQASLSITNSRSSLRLTSIESVTPSSHLILCRPLLLLPPIPPASESFPMSQLFS